MLWSRYLEGIKTSRLRCTCLNSTTSLCDITQQENRWPLFISAELADWLETLCTLGQLSFCKPWDLNKNASALSIRTLQLSRPATWLKCPHFRFVFSKHEHVLTALSTHQGFLRNLGVGCGGGGSCGLNLDSIRLAIRSDDLQPACFSSTMQPYMHHSSSISNIYVPWNLWNPFESRNDDIGRFFYILVRGGRGEWERYTL